MALLTSCVAADCLIFLASACGLFYLYATWTFRHWKKRGVPCAGVVPLFGSLMDSTMGLKSIGEAYADIYWQLKEFKFGGFFKFREPTLMICDPELIKQLIVRDFSHFHDNDIDVTVDDDPMFGRNPFCLRGERWKAVRAQMSPAFTPGKIKPFYFPLIHEVCCGLEEYLFKEHPEGLEAKELAAKFTTDVVASCAFGMNGQSFTDPNATFRQMGRDIVSGDWWLNVKWMFIFLVPKIAKIFKFRLFNEHVTNFFRGVVAEAMGHREKNHVIRNDFLQMMLQLKTKGSVDDDVTHSSNLPKITDDDVAAQAIIFFSDGFETSSTALSFALYELALNTEIQERLRSELDAALERHGGHVTYELIHEVSYLDMVLSESLRKYPPQTFLNRLCSKPYTLPTPSGGELHVEVGSAVTVPILALHYDPEYFPEPERFDPERFSEEQKATRHSHAYLPFGAGPRLCIGSRFALTQMKAGLATIVSKFELRLCKQTLVPVEIDPSSFMTAAKGGLWMQFIRRTDK